MKIPEIIIHETESLLQASQLSRQFGQDGKLLAGGTDVVVDLKQNRYYVQHLISINNFHALKKIDDINGTLKIGALVTSRELENSACVRKKCIALSEAAASMASPPIRNTATIGGNIAGGIPSADLPPSLISAEAVLHIYNDGHERQIPLKDFFVFVRETKLEAGDIITFIEIPPLPERTGIAYQKFGLREANACTVAGVAARITLENNRIITSIITLGAVAPTPLIAIKASQHLQDKCPDDEIIKEASKIAAEEARPIDDIRGTIDHRRQIVQTLTKRALHLAIKRANETG
ncbi:MAG: hypothetical protein A2Y62_10015 [Candidatus Fischerbacteria bacterium RBG_13_37_8]|uniref:FAD-binding PCMH-type domain-containing protein n=1 Tax=Candidatus Fischerbacteria bacterium RBG_13_37_8 TaxID=1817863 RepID=A0A1F5V5W6_9BACT|nr:MAG: hypothetical protein A2Y62_10015 [Candidatus Fischerbacteria bacterium RBG_13_37_8]